MYAYEFHQVRQADLIRAADEQRLAKEAVEARRSAGGKSGRSTFLTGMIEPFVGLGRPGVLGVAFRPLPSRGNRGFAAQHPTTTRPPIRKCEKVAV